MNFFRWIWEQLNWLVGLADPDNLRALVGATGEHWWWSYAILAAIVFSETGILVGFFLPGDSLLFAAGFLASQDVLDIVWLNVALSLAAILGDAVNYQLGWWMEESVLERGRLRFVKHEHLMAAKDFYERHGGIAIVLARFAPFVRTFTPFIAGIAGMSYRRFALYNVAGGIGWVALMTLSGYWLGRIEFIKQHFELVVVGIVVLSVLPIGVGILRKVWKSRHPAPTAEPQAPQANPASGDGEG